MIRINLHPAAQKRSVPSKSKTVVTKALPTTQVSRGSVLAMAMVIGWIALGVVGWLLLSGVEDEAAKFKADASKLSKETKELGGKIDTAELEAAQARYDQLSAAVELLETKRRTPIYVLYDITTVLTTGKQPLMDEAMQRQREELDPQARLDPNWDATSVWLVSMVETEGGVLELTGGTRDPDDLSEFVKRLRASARFERVSHPEFKLQEVKASGSSSTPKDPKPGELLQNYYTFELTAKVAYWD